VAALATGTLAVGIFVGAGAAFLVGNATTPDRQGMSGSAGQMNSMMGGSMMGGSMMGGADFGDMAELHAQHHGTGR
jgi:hypothetical protein